MVGEFEISRSRQLYLYLKEQQKIICSTCKGIYAQSFTLVTRGYLPQGRCSPEQLMLHYWPNPTPIIKLPMSGEEGAYYAQNIATSAYTGKNSAISVYVRQNHAISVYTEQSPAISVYPGQNPAICSLCWTRFWKLTLTLHKILNAGTYLHCIKSWKSCWSRRSGGRRLFTMKWKIFWSSAPCLGAGSGAGCFPLRLGVSAAFFENNLNSNYLNKISSITYNLNRKMKFDAWITILFTVMYFK